MISKESLEHLLYLLDYELDVCGCLRLDKKLLAWCGLGNLTHKEVAELYELLARKGYHVCVNNIWEHDCFVSRHLFTEWVELSKGEDPCNSCSQKDNGCVDWRRDRRYIMRCKYCTHEFCPFNSPKYTRVP